MPAQSGDFWPLYVVLRILVIANLGTLAIFAGFPWIGERFFGVVEHSFARLAARRNKAIWSIFLAVIAVRIALLPGIGVPSPTIHDEHSYLLMSEMFARGRLAYPEHPLWKSFETFHVNFFPVYASMFPPAQGAVLALGRLLGNPWIGVVLSEASMCAAIVWMLQAWMPSRWALLGGFIAMCNLGVASYWMNSYWGGAVAATGGALVLGALPRIFRSQRPRDGLMLGLGLAILANSRPYEGLILCLPAAAWMLWWFVSRAIAHAPLRTRAIRALLPTMAVICAVGAFMSYYNWRLTGNAWMMPHSWNYQIYYRTPLFLWQHASLPIHYNNPQFEDFYNKWVRGLYTGSLSDVRRVSEEKVRNIMTVFFWPAALPPLFCVPLALRDRRVRFLFVELLVGLGGVFVIIQSWAHYAAPLTGVFFGLLVQGFRHLRTIRTGSRTVGLGLARASIVLLLLNTGFNSYRLIKTKADPDSSGRNGVAIEKQLAAIPGEHLILVRYSPTHNPHREWVYNHADIDGSKVVWARELDSQQNEKLLSYYKDRQIWLLEPDRDPIELKPLHGDGKRMDLR